MRVPVILLFFSLAAATQFKCPKKYESSCIERASDCANGKKCTTLFGGGRKIISLLNDYANEQIDTSLQFLLMSTHMGNYKRSREGLKKLYRQLSDTAWEDAIDIMEHITLRGESVRVEPYKVGEDTEPPEDKSDSKKNQNSRESPTPPKKSLISENSVTLNELKGLAKAVEVKIKLTERAHEIYNQVNHCDPEVGSYLRKKFLHRDAETVRKLVGLTNDLKHLLDTPEYSSSSVGLNHFIMDEYIKSVF